MFQTIDGAFEMKYGKQCMDELGLKENEFSLDNPTKQQMCLFKCVADKAGILDSTGKYIEGSFEKFSSMTLTDEMKATIKECTSIKKEDPCENAFEIGKCFKQKIKMT